MTFSTGNLVGLALALGIATSAGPAEFARVRVNAFPTARSLPFYAGFAHGILPTTDCRWRSSTRKIPNASAPD